MACKQEQDSRSNRYRLKRPGSLPLPSSQRFQPYHRPRFSQESPSQPICDYYVPTPPCPAPGTWAKTFSYDDYSTKVWANDVYHQQRVYLQLQSALLQRDILMSQSAVYTQYPSCVYTPMASPAPSVFDNIALSIMNEESDPGYLSKISRVSPDGDIDDDVLDPGNCAPETANDIQESSSDGRQSVCDTSVPSTDSPVVFTTHSIKSFNPESASVPVPAPSVKTVTRPKSTSVAVVNPPAPALPVKAEPKASKNPKSRQEPGRYECNQCGKVFSWRTGFVTHLRVHSGERPYVCPDCPKSFSDYSTFAKHCRIHSGVKPYSCDICGKAFTQSGNRLRHMRTVHKAQL